MAQAFWRYSSAIVLFATSSLCAARADAAKCQYWSMPGWQPVYSGITPPPGSNPSRPPQIQGVMIIQARSGNNFSGIMQVEYFKLGADGLEERNGEDGLLTGFIQQTARQVRFRVDYPTFGVMDYEGWIVDDGRVEGLRRTSKPGTGDANDPNSWSQTWHMKAPLECAPPPPESPYKIDRAVDVSGVTLGGSTTETSSKIVVDREVRDFNPQPIPPVESRGGADVALNPQPLPPVERPGVEVGLNPQPLPPVDGGAGVVSLNPQPLPPVERPGVEVGLNPQPLPPVDGAAGAVALNPQPLPPVDSRAGAVALNPQPLPPVAVMSTTTADISPGCKSGFVWREASPGDHVCVTPDSRARVAAENAAAPTRVDPAGAYGPNTCLSGFVWREAFPGDVVCVTPEVRTLVREENSQAAVRKL